MLWNSWLAVTLQAARLGWEAQHAMARRLMGLDGDAKVTELPPVSTGETVMPPTPEAGEAPTPKIASGDGKRHEAAEQKFKVHKKRVRASGRRRVKQHK
jgi:hypothetical protein